MKRWRILVHPDAADPERLAARVAAMAAAETGDVPPAEAITVERAVPEPGTGEWQVVEEQASEIGVDLDLWEEILSYVSVRPDVTVEREDGVAWLRRRRVLAALVAEGE